MNEVDIGEVLRKLSDQLQGYALDLVRISEMGDRQFMQFERSIKKHFRETIDATTETLKDIKEFKVSDRPTSNSKN